MSSGYAGLRIAEVHALCELGTALLEVRGRLVIRQGRRLSDHANHPDPMLELDEAATRLLRVGVDGRWEASELLSVNRDRVAVLVPFDEEDPGADPKLVPPTRDVRVRLTCPAAVVEGSVKVPVASTIASFIHETRNRYLAVTGATLTSVAGGPGIGELAGDRAFCMVNRGHVVSCAELPPDPLRAN